MRVSYWVGMASSIAVGVWLGATLYYATMDLLACSAVARLWEVAAAFVLAAALGYWVGRRLAPRMVWTVAHGFAPRVRR